MILKVKKTIATPTPPQKNTAYACEPLEDLRLLFKKKQAPVLISTDMGRYIAFISLFGLYMSIMGRKGPSTEKMLDINYLYKPLDVL